MRILVTNDDGIYSPGLAALAVACQPYGETRVVAPDVEQSSAGHAITASRPLWYRRTRIGDGLEGFRVNGTPADCVALGVDQWKPDLVVSGINLGPNLGNAMWHSGTLAAAKQAVLLGVRGIAFSTLVRGELPDFATLEPFIQRALELLVPRSELRLVNVNLPPQPRGLTWTRQAIRHYDGRVVPGTDPMGREHYWFTVVPLEEHDPGTDLWAMEHGYVSLTPLELDLTDHDALARVRRELPLDEVDASVAPEAPGRGAVPESADAPAVAKA